MAEHRYWPLLVARRAPRRSDGNSSQAVAAVGQGDTSHVRQGGTSQPVAAASHDDLLCEDMPAERLSIQERRSFNDGFNFTAKDRKNQGICGTHERTRFLRWLDHPYYRGEKLHPVRLDSRGQPHYFCRGWFCSREYCMYHLTHECEFDRWCKSQGLERNERGIPYRPEQPPPPPPPEDPEETKRKRDEEDQPPPPPEEDPEGTIFPEPPPPPSPESPSSDGFAAAPPAPPSPLSIIIIN